MYVRIHALMRSLKASSECVFHYTEEINQEQKDLVFFFFSFF